MAGSSLRALLGGAHRGGVGELEEGEDTAMKKNLRLILCKCGIHEWKSDGENLESTVGKGLITVVWRECKHCYKPKLIMFIRN